MLQLQQWTERLAKVPDAPLFLGGKKRLSNLQMVGGGGGSVEKKQMEKKKSKNVQQKKKKAESKRNIQT